jgi:hypothetical protein
MPVVGIDKNNFVCAFNPYELNEEQLGNLINSKTIDQGIAKSNNSVLFVISIDEN